MKKLRTFGLKSFIKEFVIRFIDHDVAQIGGQIAYFTILSIFPFLIYITKLIASVNISQTEVVQLLSPFVADEILQFIISYIENVQNVSGAGIMSFGIIVTIYSASRVLRSLESAVNRAYNVQKRRGYLKSVLYSMIVTVCMGLAILIAVLLVVAGKKMLGIIFAFLGLSGEHITLVLVFKWIFALAAVYGLVAVVYFIMPSKKITFKSTLPGAAISTVGLGLFSAGFGIYTKYFAVYSVVYGSIGTVFLVLVWAYFAGTILVSGAEINCMIHEFYKKSDKKDD